MQWAGLFARLLTLTASTQVLTAAGLSMPPVAIHDQVPATITFTRDIAPIIFGHCSTCHRPGAAAPFSLVTYDDTRRHAMQIAAATASRYMPPWKPEPGVGEFADERRLTDLQLSLIRQWVDQGATEGDPDDLPPTPRWGTGWQLGEPDLVVTMSEPYILRNDGADVFRSFVIPIPISIARYVKGLEFHPGNFAAVHHANIKIDDTRSSRRIDDEDPGPGFEGGGGRDARFPDGHFLGWTPGQSPHIADDTAWRLAPGSDFVIEVHLRPTGKPEPVQVSVALFFSDAPARRQPYMIRLGKQSIDIPPGERAHLVTDSYVLPVDVEVLAVQPHAHYLARRVSGFARLPDGTTRWLIDIKDWDFNWQDVYRYIKPIPLPGGTTLVMQYLYDNSDDNVRNPNRPPKRVTFGQTTSSEMGDLWLEVVAAHGDDLAILAADFAPKMLAEDIAGDEKRLEVDDHNARLRADLASCYLAAGRVDDAIGQLQVAIRLEPEYAPARLELGSLLLRQRRLDQAAEQLGLAVRLNRNLSEAHNNLGVVWFLQGMVDEAIQSYREALRLEPDNADAHYNLGRALSSQGSDDEAVGHYRSALQVRPDDAEALSALAAFLATHGQVEEAISHYRRALQLKPDLPAPLVDLAWILATSESTGIRAPDEAIDLAEHAADLTKYNSPTVLDTLAVAYFAAGDLVRAVRVAEAALDLASASGATELASRIRERLKFYQQQPLASLSVPR